MDLQTRKLNIIAYLAQIQDENFISKIEKLVFKENKYTEELEPFTTEELIERIEKSEEDFKNGKFKSYQDLKNFSSNW